MDVIALTVLLLTLFGRFKEASQSPQQESSVQSVSEGSDCRCKCILSTEDDGPCDDNAVGGPRKTVYTVETISGGSDCRCSCNTPPPTGCDMPMAPTEVVNKMTDDRDGGDIRQSGSDQNDINLIELHGSISSMVAAMIKLERAVMKTSSPHELRVIRNNVKKVVQDLKATNGSYDDAITDLELDLQETDSNYGEQEDVGTEVPPLESPVDPTTPTDAIVTATSGGFEDIISANQVSAHNEDSSILHMLMKGSGMLAEAEKSWHRPMPDSSKQAKGSMNDGLDIIRNFVAARSNHAADTQTDAEENLDLNGEERSHSGIPAVELGPGNIVQPRILSFVPYRSIGAPGVAGGVGPPKSQDAGYQYDYEYLDTIHSQDDNSTTEEPIPEDAFETMGTTPDKTNIPEYASSPATALNSSISNANSTEGNTDTNYSYSDYLGEYEDDYDYLDEYYEDLAAVPSTPSATTPTPTTASTENANKCGTLARLSRLHVVSHFGRKEGAWMRDPVPSEFDPDRHKRIYIANFYYGSNLIEFENVEGVRDLTWRTSYSLPHKWIGTGHIVYNGSFYYNRAFSRSLIKYDLQSRFVSAWSHLSNAIYDPTTPFTWRGHSMLHMVADEDGLWVIFPSQDPFDSDAKPTYIISNLNPVDLRVLKSFKSSIRQSVSHLFMICGVVYSTEHYDTRYGRVTHAFDTKTLKDRYIYLPFENRYSYTVQMLYNPKERKIYAWDNGRQIEYEAELIY